MRLTPPFNLPAPGRRQTLYIASFALQSPVFLVNSRLGHFTATPSGLEGKPPHPGGAPLLPKLRGWFAEFLNEGSLTRLRILSLSTCAGLRYGHLKGLLEGFLGSVDLVSWFDRGRTSPLSSELMASRICLESPPKIAAGYFHSPVYLSFCVTPSLKTPFRWCRNVDLLSIAYAFRPRLRDRLTLSGRTFLRKP